jgi:hypothetical protein
MYRTIESLASVKADATVGEETGPRLTVLEPVLCCPAVVGVVGAAANAVGSSAMQAAAVGSNIAEAAAGVTAAEVAAGVTAAQAAANSFTASVMYVPPGRLSVNSTPVSSSASVEELISAVRADHIPA